MFFFCFHFGFELCVCCCGVDCHLQLLFVVENCDDIIHISWAGKRSRYSDWLRVRRSGDRIPLGARFSAPV
jgi:hypothetical protein